MKALVLHKNNANFDEPKSAPNMRDFRLVASIEELPVYFKEDGTHNPIPTLERVFDLTNHIDEPWTSNPEVDVWGLPRQRSTSVGDIVILRADTQAPRVYYVMNCGWEETHFAE